MYVCLAAAIRSRCCAGPAAVVHNHCCTDPTALGRGHWRADPAAASDMRVPFYLLILAVIAVPVQRLYFAAIVQTVCSKAALIGLAAGGQSRRRTNKSIRWGL